MLSKSKIREADYQAMVDVYLELYANAAKTKFVLPYIVPVSSGYDARPWHGTGAVLRTEPTPEKFKQMLMGAKRLIESRTSGNVNVLMIEAWNEFGEGAFIEPTRKWGYEYLRLLNEIF